MFIWKDVENNIEKQVNKSESRASTLAIEAIECLKKKNIKLKNKLDVDRSEKKNCYGVIGTFVNDNLGFVKCYSF